MYFACEELFRSINELFLAKPPRLLSAGILARSLIEYYFWFFYFLKDPIQAEKDFDGNTKANFNKFYKNCSKKDPSIEETFSTIQEGETKVKGIAEKAGLLPQYKILYSSISMYTHPSPFCIMLLKPKIELAIGSFVIGAKCMTEMIESLGNVNSTTLNKLQADLEKLLSIIA